MGSNRRNAEPPAGGIMTVLRMLLARVLGIVNRGRRDAALDDDIQAHLDLLTSEYIDRGFSPRDAEVVHDGCLGASSK
jgi:hypothetical protein